MTIQGSFADILLRHIHLFEVAGEDGTNYRLRVQEHDAEATTSKGLASKFFMTLHPDPYDMTNLESKQLLVDEVCTTEQP